MSDSGPTSDSARPTVDLSGRQVGDFHFLRRLGRGAMAEVYLAEQRPLKRWVAVKILRPELADDQTYLKRFEREAQAAASLVHANIVQIHEVGHVDGLHYIVQEYVQGQNLRDWLSRNGPPLLQPALSIMRQIAAALAKAAEQGVIHRDIKPENIMITATGEVKVADFGLARVVRENDLDATSLTQIGITMGTPLYMSPEQVEGRPLDHRSDLYSFGVLCYHMLTGKPPFVGDTALAVAVQHVKTQPKALEQQRPDLPPALCRVVHQMLAKAPDQRWHSCGELLRELYRIQVEYCPLATPQELASWDSVGMEPLTDPRLQAKRQLAEAMHELPRPAGRGRRWAIVGGMAAALIAGGGAAWFTMRPASLAPAQHGEKSNIPQQDTQWRQWFHASRIGTEEAWKSVIDYPGVSELVALAPSSNWRGSISVSCSSTTRWKCLTNWPPTTIRKSRHSPWRASAACCRSKRSIANRPMSLDQFWPWRQYLHDIQMTKMLRRTIDKNRDHLGPPTSHQWDDWLERQFGTNAQEGPVAPSTQLDKR